MNLSETDRNKAAVLAFADAYSRGDWDAVEALCTEDFRWIVPNAEKMQSPSLASLERVMSFRDLSRDEMMQTFRATQANCIGGRFDIVVGQLTAEDDRVAAEAESHAVSKSTGRTYHNHYIWLMTFREGKIAQFREYQDTLHAFDVWMAP